MMKLNLPNKYQHLIKRLSYLAVCVVFLLFISMCNETNRTEEVRQKISINDNWQFIKYNSASDTDSLIYDVRPNITEFDDDIPADTEPTDAIYMEADDNVLKPWILLSGNDFIKNPDVRHERPEGSPGIDFPFVQLEFDDTSRETVNLPHEWAIAGRESVTRLQGLILRRSPL